MLEYVLAGCGFFSIGATWYILKQSFIKLQQNKKQLQDIQACKKYRLSQQKQKINFKSIMSKKQGQMIYIEIPKQQLTNYTAKTFRRQYSAVNNNYPKQYLHDGFMNHSCGDSFTISRQNHKVIVDIRDCNIYANMLDKWSTPIVLVDKNSKESTKTIYQDIVYHAIPNISLTVIGTLEYNIIAKQFILLPNFMFRYKGGESSLNVVRKYFNNYNSELLSMIGLSGALLSFFLWMNWGRLKNFWNFMISKIKNVMAWTQEDQSSLDDLLIAKARGSQKLKCQCGNSINIIYRCGHLDKCQVCNQRQQIKICRICGRLSNDFMKVYI